MNAGELRIGNLVECGALYLPYGEGSIVEILADCVTCCVGTDMYTYLFDDLKPIPLNEDWLIRAGFEKSTTQDKFFTKGNNIGISTADDKFRFIQGNFVCQLVLTDLQHVHQLQNLYYCLCGKELEFK
jgi:hypothetical protein